jgi:hypothetical protein
MKGEPGGDQCCDDYEKAKISNAEMQLFKVCDLYLAGLLASFVLLGRGGGGGMHRGIISYAFDRLLCRVARSQRIKKQQGRRQLCAAAYSLVSL